MTSKLTVIASEAKRSIQPPRPMMDCFASLAMTGGWTWKAGRTLAGFRIAASPAFRRPSP